MSKKHKDYEVWRSYVVPGFSDIMINQLAKHGDRGDNWKDADPDWLLRRAKEELEEVEKALNDSEVYSDFKQHIKQLNCIAKECADVANFMMMIADSVDSI